MKIGVNLKIDVTKIDKSKLFKGQKGTYLDCVAFIDIDNQGQFGDNGMITQEVTKEEKEAGVRGEILGNVRVFWRDAANDGYQQTYQPTQQQAAQPTNQSAQDFDDDIPF